jgi:hypothetical protein
MVRKAILGALLLSAPAAADEALRVPAGAAKAAAGRGAPGGLSLSLAPRAVLTALTAVGRDAEADACPVGQCAPGDQACRQNVFHAVLGCLEEGRLACADCAPPGGGTTLFRAHGGGVTLYGAIGPRRAAGPRLLHAIGRAVEAPPLLNFAPAEGGPP